MQVRSRRPPRSAADPGAGGRDAAATEDRFRELGVDGAQVEAWRLIGCDAFEAAMGQGDGFTPADAVPYRHQLRRTARSWARRSLDTAEGLCWHRAGFSAREATRWRTRGVDVGEARLRRDGYAVGSRRVGDEKRSNGSEHRSHDEEREGVK